MKRSILTDWTLASYVERQISAVAPDELICSFVRPSGTTTWDEGCPDVGQSAWEVDLVWPGRVLMPGTEARVKLAIAELQERFDLGLTRG
jgi:hypothetical protein